MKPTQPNLTTQRCFNHAQREAVARCPSCHQFFCRECVTEHDDQVICTACLKKRARVPLLQRPGFLNAGRLAQCLLGLLAAWFFFFLIGEALLSLPSSFHEGALWRVKWLDKK
jgi:hypothetical protein